MNTFTVLSIYGVDGREDRENHKPSLVPRSYVKLLCGREEPGNEATIDPEDRESHRPNTHLLFKLQSPVKVGAVEAEASLQ